MCELNKGNVPSLDLGGYPPPISVSCTMPSPILFFNPTIIPNVDRGGGRQSDSFLKKNQPSKKGWTRLRHPRHWEDRHLRLQRQGPGHRSVASPLFAFMPRAHPPQGEGSNFLANREPATACSFFFQLPDRLSFSAFFFSTRRRFVWSSQQLFPPFERRRLDPPRGVGQRLCSPQPFSSPLRGVSGEINLREGL